MLDLLHAQNMTKLERLQMIETYYKNFNKENYAGMLELLDSNVIHEVNQGEPQVGRDQFAQFLNHMKECYLEKLEDIVLMASDQQSLVAAEFVVDGIYLKTDGKLPEAKKQKYKIKAGAFFDFKNGKISRVTTYYNLPQWIKLVQSVN